MKKIITVVAAGILIFLLIVGYTSHIQTESPYDATYWKERYDQSQWMLLGSKHTIGDDGLYAFVGYSMMHGRDPTTINAEMPPFGKYLIGLSILLTGSWWTASYGAYILVLGVFFALAWMYLGALPKEKRLLFSLISTGLFAADPLLLKQAYMSMLDATLLLFLLIHAYLTKRYADHRDMRWTILTGLSLGLFAAVKFPAFAPILALSTLAAILTHGYRIQDAMIYGSSAAIAYLGTYVVYFFSGHSLFDWLKVQKWIINFYTSSHLPRYYDSVYGYLFTGRYRDLFTGGWSEAPEKTTVWIVCIIIIGGILAVRWRSVLLFVRANASISILTAGILVLCTIVPFWPRYMLLLIPFLYLGSIVAVSRTTIHMGFLILASLVLFIINLRASALIIIPPVDSRIGEITYEWNHQFFGDLVRHTTVPPASYDSWIRTMNNVVTQSRIQSMRIKTDPITTPFFGSEVTIPATITYLLKDCGVYNLRTSLHMMRVDGGWKLSWNWSNIYPSFTDSSSIIYRAVPNRRGSITSSDGQILAEDGIGTTISLIPKNIDPSTEEALYRRLSEIFDNTVSFDAIQARVRTTTRYSEPIDIGSLYLPEDIRDELLSRYTGGAVILTPAIVRRVYGGDGYVGKTGNMYSDDFGNLLYSPVTSNGISGLEKTYDTDLSAEGICTLSIHDASGRITLIKDWPVKEATSVRLP